MILSYPSWLFCRRVVLALVLGFLTAPSTSAATWVVTNLGDSLSNLTCDADCTIREALAVAQDGDSIEWSSTLSYPAVTMLASVLTINRNLTINGPGAHKLELNAQDQSRVMKIEAPASSVAINDLALAHGGLIGAQGGQVCGTNSFGDPFCTAGLPGTSVEGGCVHSSVAFLRLARVNIHHCMLVGGGGGFGNSDAAGAIGPYGYPGGDGGTAIGGALFSSGALDMVESSIHSVSIAAGAGGNGGTGNMMASIGPGGQGGWVAGGALYSGGGARLRNVTVSVDMVSSGIGGFGGAIRDSSGAIVSWANGGSGGNIYGAIWAFSGVSKASFSTFRAGNYDLGVRAFAGNPVDGALHGRFMHANDGSSPLSLHKSIFVSTVSTDPIAPVSYCNGSAISFNNSLVDQACSGATVTAANLGEKTTGAQGIVTLPPSFSASVAVNGASDCLDADGAVVTHDANGNARPEFGFCDLGAHEVTDTMFKNGFD